MRSEELVAAGDLAAAGFSGATAHVRQVHDGIAGRVFRSIGAASAPVRLLHDGIADLAYGATGLIGAGVVRGAATLAGRTRRPDAPSLDRSPRGRLVVGALNGAVGDALHARSSALAAEMTIRCDGAVVPLEIAAVRRAFPAAGPRLAVFLHGLCETEAAWRLYGERWPSFPERMRGEAGLTPVELRYNSGRHISENGRELARLLGELLGAWPTEVTAITLIGHSMGGLVARSACHYGAGTDAIDRVRHVVSLGAPHHGARLERQAHAIG